MPEVTIDQILGRLENVRKLSQDSWSAKCPIHDDRQNSLFLSLKEDGKLLMYCHNPECDTPRIVHALGFRMYHLMAPSERTKGGNTKSRRMSNKEAEKHITQIYEYKDPTGNVLYEIARIEKGGKKEFRCRHKNKEGKYLWSLKGVQTVPYNLDQVVAAKEVWIVEGEKDVETLRSEGIVATCNPLGAGKWKKEFAKWLSGKHCVVIPDNDRPGQEHAAQVAESLEGVTKSLKIVKLPGATDKGEDVTDWLNKGNSIQDLKAAIARAKPISKGGVRQARYEDILKELGLIVAGHREMKYAMVYSLDRNAFSLIHVQNLTIDQLFMVCGNRAEKVDPRPMKGSTRFLLSDVKAAISLIAGKTNLNIDARILGDGCWSAKKDFDGQIVISSKCPILVKRIGKRLSVRKIDASSIVSEYGIIGSPGSTFWFSPDKVIPMLKSWDQSECQKAVADAEDLLRIWTWANGDVDIQLMVGLILSAWMQSLWKWRPHIGICGRKSSGKTNLLLTLRSLFGSLAVKCSDPTPSAIRQVACDTSRIILIDEMDNNRHHDQIIEMARYSSRNEEVIRGAPNQVVRHQRFYQMFWLAGVFLNMVSDIDAERFIRLELEALDRNKKEIPPQDELAELGARLFCTSVYCAEVAYKMANVLANTPIQMSGPSLQQRVYETYSVPAAMYWAATKREKSHKIFGDFLSRKTETQRFEEMESYETELLEEILSSRIDVGRGKKYAAIEILSDDGLFGTYKMEIESHGLSLRYPSDGLGKILFIYPRAVRRYLLGKTKWKNSDVASVLLRANGAQRSARRLCGRVARGVDIPWDRVIGDQDLSEEEQQEASGSLPTEAGLNVDEISF